MTRLGVALLFLFIAAGCNRPVQPGDPIPGLARAERDRFARGKVVFDSEFTPDVGATVVVSATPVAAAPLRAAT